MAYQRRNFQAGQKLKSNDLNVMDMQIEENERKAMEAQGMASNANQKAAAAQDIASDANQIATEAQGVASDAENAAENAMAAAVVAKTAATNAEKTANEAKKMRLQLNTLIGMLYTNGVLEDGTNPLQSFPVGGMRLAVKPGTVVFDGTLYKQAETQTIGFDISNTENIIALGYRYDRNEKTVYELRAENCVEQGTILIHKNANGEQETLPSRNDAVYDVIHTILRIPANAAAITQSMIQDARNKQAYCGYAKFRMIGM